jgi:Family of unknown function (DUF6412)
VLPALSTIWAGAWLFLATPSTDVLSLTAVAAIAVLAVLAAGALLRATAAGGTTAAPAAVRPATIDAAHGVPRLCDPDAAGRPRPRAPSANPAA